MKANSLRVAFAGTPDFAKAALSAIVDAGFDVPIVLTQPDRPAGRGLKLQASAVKQYALAHQLPVLQPISLNCNGRYAQQAQQAWEALTHISFDVMVVAAYGLLLPKLVLDYPRYGCLNIHASLLPRWRGAAPIHRAIEAGDQQTGITIMQMDEGLDTGEQVVSDALPILPEDNIQTLHDKLQQLGAHLIVQALLDLQAKGHLPSKPQAAEGVTYAQKVTRQEATIDWRQTAAEIALKVRAFYGFPVATTSYLGEHIKVWAGFVDAKQVTQAVPGTLLHIGEVIAVACGQGTVFCATELQKAGGQRLPVKQMQLNNFLSLGQCFV